MNSTTAAVLFVEILKNLFNTKKRDIEVKWSFEKNSFPGKGIDFGTVDFIIDPPAFNNQVTYAVKLLAENFYSKFEKISKAKVVFNNFDWFRYEINNDKCLIGITKN